jgi:predicted Zn-dependent protease
MLARSRRGAVLLAALWHAAWCASAMAAPRWSPEKEAAIGRRAAGKLEKQVGVWHDSAAQARLEKIIANLAPHTSPQGLPFDVPRVTHPPVDWQVKLLATDAINAISLPGGYVYCTRGMYRAAESDDELAAVLAHEMSHTLLYHALEQSAKGKEVLIGSLAAAVLAIALKGVSRESVGVIMAGQSVGAGLMSHYSVEDEDEADTLGVAILQASEYNPVAMLTVQEGLARGRQLLPRPEVDVYRTHPYAEDRVRSVREKLEALGVEIDRRAVTRWEEAEAVDCLDEGLLRPQLQLWGEVVFTAAAAAEGADDSAARVEAAAEALTKALEDGLVGFEVQPGAWEGRPAVLVRGEPILAIHPGDATLAGKTPAEVANEAALAVRRAMARRALKQKY